MQIGERLLNNQDVRSKEKAESSSYYELHSTPHPTTSNDKPAPPGYVRQEVGRSGGMHVDISEEKYYDHLLLNYS